MGDSKQFQQTIEECNPGYLQEILINETKAQHGAEEFLDQIQRI